MPIKRSLLLLLFAYNMLSCALLQTCTDKTENLLPREIELPGWKTTTDPKIFNSDNIQEYIKTPEDIRLLDIYGFQELSIAVFNSLSKPDRTITVEIFKMDSSLNAFGILSMERSDEYKKEDSCEDSYSTAQSLFARKNSYYIKIKSNQKYAESISDNKFFLKTVCDKIKKTDPLPDYLSLFGEKNDRMPLKYRIEGHPKLLNLINIFTRKTEIAGNTRTIFFSKRQSSYVSIGEFSKLLKDKEKQFILSSAGEMQVAFFKIKDDDFIFISVYKEWIFGIFDAASMAEGEKTISYLYNNLNEFLKEAG